MAIRPVAIFSTVIGLAALSLPAKAQSLDELYAKAKSEGAFVLYVGGPTAPWEAMAKVFNAKYPGITVSISGGFSNVLDKKVDAQIAAARGNTAESLAAYRLAVLKATEEVENSFSALVNREAQVDILIRGESSLSRARDNSLAAYKGGVVSLIEVLDADSNLLQVQDAKAQAQTEAARAAIASFRALGGGWDPRNADDKFVSAFR